MAILFIGFMNGGTNKYRLNINRTLVRFVGKEKHPFRLTKQLTVLGRDAINATNGQFNARFMLPLTNDGVQNIDAYLSWCQLMVARIIFDRLIISRKAITWIIGLVSASAIITITVDNRVINTTVNTETTVQENTQIILPLIDSAGLNKPIDSLALDTGIVPKN